MAENLEPLPLQVQRADKVGDRIYVEGNAAAALGAVYGGATVCAWYPITPSTSVMLRRANCWPASVVVDRKRRRRG